MLRTARPADRRCGIVGRLERSMGEGRFKVNRILEVDGRAGLLACGDIVEGTVAVGMNLIWPLRGEVLTTLVAISAVECLDVEPSADAGAGRFEIALALRFEDDAGEMPQMFRDRLEPGMVVDVVAAPERADRCGAGQSAS
jgi:hypothetical protein